MNKKIEKEYQLSDFAIAKIVDILQLGIMNQEDVTEQFRALKLVLNNEKKLIPKSED